MTLEKNEFKKKVTALLEAPLDSLSLKNKELIRYVDEFEKIKNKKGFSFAGENTDREILCKKEIKLSKLYSIYKQQSFDVDAEMPLISTNLSCDGHLLITNMKVYTGQVGGGDLDQIELSRINTMTFEKKLINVIVTINGIAKTKLMFDSNTKAAEFLQTFASTVFGNKSKYIECSTEQNPFQPSPQPAAQAPTLDKRSILDQEILKYAQKGYVLQTQTDSSAQLKQPKEFSWGWFIVITILSGITLFWIYPLYFLVAKKDKNLYLQVDDNGNVSGAE